jgi:hypothetical protein
LKPAHIRIRSTLRPLAIVLLVLGVSACGREAPPRAAPTSARQPTFAPTPTLNAETAPDHRAGAERGVRSTPTFLVNGQPFIGARPYADWQRYLDTLLAR